MNTLNLITTFNKLCLRGVQLEKARSIATAAALQFRATPCLMAEPLKKKKRMDPAVIKAREDRKKKKIEKQIRRLEKNERQLKPIDECEVPLTLLDEKKERTRNLSALSAEELERRALLNKQWAFFKLRQHLQDVQMLDRIQFAQQKALDELRKESEELYQEAIQIDFRMLPYKSEGPLETPPNPSYESPDGNYNDISKKWE